MSSLVEKWVHDYNRCHPRRQLPLHPVSLDAAQAYVFQALGGSLDPLPPGLYMTLTHQPEAIVRR